MRPQLEKVTATFRSSWRYHELSEPRFRFEWHHHEEYELTLVTAGHGRRFVGSSISAYGPGDLVLIGPDLPHAYETPLPGGDTVNEAVVLQFRRDFLGDDLLAAPEFAGVSRLLDQASRGLCFNGEQGEGMRRQILQLRDEQGVRRTLGLLQVLAEAAELRPQVLAAADYAPRPHEEANLRIDAVCRLLHASYAEAITLERAAEAAHMSPGAFSRFFHRTMGRTFQGYLTELRIGAACRLLAETEHPVSRVATECGYHNITNFNRRFRQVMEINPSTYRTYFRQRGPQATPGADSGPGRGPTSGAAG